MKASVEDSRLRGTETLAFTPSYFQKKGTEPLNCVKE